MRLSRRQLEGMNEMLRHDNAEIREAYKYRNEMLRKSRLNEASDAAVEPMRVDMENITKAVGSSAEDAAFAHARFVLEKFHFKAMDIIASTMNKNAVSSMTLTGKELSLDLEDAFEDEFSELQMQLETDVMNVLVKYTVSLSKLAVQLAGGDTPEE